MKKVNLPSAAASAVRPCPLPPSPSTRRTAFCSALISTVPLTDGRFCSLAGTGVSPMSVCADWSTYGLVSSVRVAAEVSTGSETRAPEGNGTKFFAWPRSITLRPMKAPFASLRTEGMRRV